MTCLQTGSQGQKRDRNFFYPVIHHKTNRSKCKVVIRCLIQTQDVCQQIDISLILDLYFQNPRVKRLQFHRNVHTHFNFGNGLI